MNKTLAVVLGIIVILGIIFLANSGDNNVLTLNDEANEEQNAPLNNGQQQGQGTQNGNNATPDEAINSVQLRDTTEGSAVTIQSAKLSQPGYIVIYRTNQNGVADEIGHTGLLQKGDYAGMTINLDTAIVAEQTIVAALHKDDGDGVFEVPGADGYMGSGLNRLTTDVDVVEVPFGNEPTSLQAQVNSYLEYTDATTTP